MATVNRRPSEQTLGKAAMCPWPDSEFRLLNSVICLLSSDFCLLSSDQRQ